MAGKPRFEDGIEAPYPLKRYFRTRIVPLLLLFVAVLVAATTASTRSVLEGVYLRLAVKRAEGISQGVRRTAPEAWERLMTGLPLDADQRAALTDAFADEQKEFKVAHLKVYDTRRVTIFADDPAQMGKMETGPALARVIAGGVPGLVAQTEPDGTELYELYVPLHDAGQLAAVYELYEPVTDLDRILVQAQTPMILYPGLALVLLLLSLTVLIRRAQGDIDARTSLINTLRRRLESLVSRSAVRAVHDAGDHSRIPSRYEDCTLFYSDIRDFTGYSEKHSPAEVVDFLNELMTIQVQAVLRHDGDVDKMIGDAVLARFQGPDKERRALDAALEIQRSLPGQGFPRGIGIGLYSGRVIAGGIGTRGRQDYTIIGDAVNVSARLCSLAREGQIVADAETLATAGGDDFGPPGPVIVKGRTNELLVRTWPRDETRQP